MKKIAFFAVICFLSVSLGMAQYAPWTPAQGPLNFMTLDFQNHHYVRASTSSSLSSFESSSGISSQNGYYSHKLITTQAADPCRCYQVGNTYPHENYLPISWSGNSSETLDTVIMVGCNNCSNGCTPCADNSQLEYWFYPQPGESTLLVYFSFAEEDVSYHEASYNPRFYIEVIDGVTGQLIPSGYYKRANGTINTAWPYNRFLAVPSGSNSAQDTHTAPDENGITTYYWAFPEATPTTFPFRKCPPSQSSGLSSYDVGWFEYKPVAFDLSDYAAQGKSVKLRIRVRACGAMYHWAYCLFAAKMIPGDIHVDACGEEPVQLSVPWGFLEQTYEWHYGYDSLDACNRILDFDQPGISGTIYKVSLDRNLARIWPYYRCEMKSYTGVPFVYEAHIKSYYLDADFGYEQLFNNCDLTVHFMDSSDIFVITPPTQQGGTEDTVRQQTQLIQWLVKRRDNNAFIPFAENTLDPVLTFDNSTISENGEATVRIIIQDSARICVDTIEKVIHLDMTATENSSATDTVSTCEEKLPFVYDSQYFGETQTWSTEGTRRVNYETLAWNGCDSLVDVTLIVRKPKVEIAFDLDYCDAFTTTLSAESEDDIAQYKWSTGETTPSITITAPGTYSVEIQNEDGCSATNTITIPACKPFLNLPNTITPSNLDGMNDYFYIPQRSLIKELEFTVFNRNGEVVYHTTNKDFEWNGSVNGKLMVGSTFTYTLHITDYEGVSSSHKGSITVL